MPPTPSTVFNRCVFVFKTASCMRTHMYAILLQLMKALFGTNLSSQWPTGGEQSAMLTPAGFALGSRLGGQHAQRGLHHCCFTSPYTQFTQCLASATFRFFSQHHYYISSALVQARLCVVEFLIVRIVFRSTALSEQDEQSWINCVRRRAEKKTPSVLKSGSQSDKVGSS